MSTIDLLLRYVIISIAFQLACAWAYALQSPWPLADAFQLAPSAKSQLFQSLGICFDSLITSLCRTCFLRQCGATHAVWLAGSRKTIVVRSHAEHAGASLPTLGSDVLLLVACKAGRCGSTWAFAERCDRRLLSG